MSDSVIYNVDVSNEETEVKKCARLAAIQELATSTQKKADRVWILYM